MIQSEVKFSLCPQELKIQDGIKRMPENLPIRERILFERLWTMEHWR